MDMEWAKDGRTGELFIVQARPETVHSQRDPHVLETYRLKQQGPVLITGRSVGEKIGCGQARIIKDVHQLNAFRAGEILVAEKTDPDWEPIMKLASGIVTNRGGPTCHAAIVSRELGLPAVVVSRDELGTINHTLLTLEALRARGLAVKGVVLLGGEKNRASIERYGDVAVVEDALA